MAYASLKSYFISLIEYLEVVFKIDIFPASFKRKGLTSTKEGRKKERGINREEKGNERKLVDNRRGWKEKEREE